MAVRRERVIVEADDRYTGPLTRMAASTGAFRMAMADAEKQSKPFQRAVKQNAKETNAFTREAAKAGSEIDRLSGRMRIMLEMGVLIGPAFLPVGAIAVPAVMGLANAMGAAALGAGAIAAALPGVGDAVKALGEFRDDPSAANAEKLAEAFEKIGPDAREFAVAIQRDALPALRRMRDEAAAGGLPWLTEAIGELEEIEPRVSRILRALADATGEEIFDAAESFNTERWDEFFTFLETEVPGTISDVAAATGNLTHGLAEMWMAFAPVNDDFGNWLVNRTSDFDAWAERLDSTEGFDDFLEFVEETGPQLEDFAGSFVDAFVQIADAAAPFSGPTLTVLTKLLDVTASIADSDLGTPLFGLAAGLAAVNRTMAITGALSRSQAAQGGIIGAIGATRRGERDLGALASGLMNVTTAQERAATSADKLTRRQQQLRAGIANAARGGAGIVGLGVASSDAANGLGVANTASLALLGTMVAPGWGTAFGVVAGGFMDVASAGDATAAAVDQADRSYRNFLRDGAAKTRTQDLVDEFERLRQAREDVQNDVGFGTFLSEIKGVSKVIPGVEDKDERFAALDAEEDKLNDLQGEWEAEAAARRRNLALAARQSKGFDANKVAMDSLVSSTIAFSASLQDVNALLNNRASLRNYEAALDALNETAGRFSWDPGGEAGRSNLARLDALVGNAIQRSQELKEEGKDLASIKVLQRAIGDLQDFAAKTPAAKEAIKPLLRELRELAGARANPDVDVDTRSAREELAALRKALRDTDGDSATVQLITELITRKKTETITGDVGDILEAPFRGPKKKNRALGGFDGGYQPMMLDSGPTLYMWREPETKGESFIPHANDHRRPRAKSILEQTASLFGGSVVWNAVGGVYGQGRMQPITVSAGSSVARMTGAATVDLRTPWGSEQIEVQMREIARDEIDGESRFRSNHKVS